MCIRDSIFCFFKVSDALRRSTNTTVLCDGPNSHETIPRFQYMEEYSNKTRCDFAVDYSAMQYSLLINNVVEVIGGFFFLVTAIYIIKDKLRCDRYVAGKICYLGSSLKPAHHSFILFYVYMFCVRYHIF